MSTSENQSSAHAPAAADGPGGSLPVGSPGRKTLLIAAVGVAIVLLAGGALFAMWSQGAAAEESEETNSSSASKKSKPSKPAAKEEKEGKSKHGAKEDKKKEGKSAHAKKPAKDSKHASKEPKGEKGHAKPGKEEKPLETTGERRQQRPDGSSTLVEGDDQPAFLGKGRARLGPFSVKIFDPLTHTMLRTDFSLEGVIACEDETEFERFLRSSQQFFREQVMVSMRTSDAVDFADPSLQLVKRRIVARVNRALGRPFLKSVELKNFTVYESVENSPYVRWQPAAADEVTRQSP